MPQLSSRFGLPLVHHFMQQSLPDTLPPVPAQVAQADDDLVRSHRRQPEFADPPAHPAGERHPDSPEAIAEVDLIEAVMQLVQPGEKLLFIGGRADRRTGGRWRMQMDRKGREDALRFEAILSTNSRFGPSGDRSDDGFGG